MNVHPDTPTVDDPRRSAPSSDIVSPDWPTPYSEPPLPDQIGAYRILSRVGEGGIGVVYKAEQREPVIRIVALKLIKLGMDTREVIARFETERQALAVMNHPNVAKVLDAGATEGGRPYFVMEYVAGEPITGFADRHKLTPPPTDTTSAAAAAHVKTRRMDADGLPCADTRARRRSGGE